MLPPPYQRGQKRIVNLCEIINAILSDPPLLAQPFAGRSDLAIVKNAECPCSKKSNTFIAARIQSGLSAERLGICGHAHRGWQFRGRTDRSPPRGEDRALEYWPRQSCSRPRPGRLPRQRPRSSFEAKRGGHSIPNSLRCLWKARRRAGVGSGGIVFDPPPCEGGG